MALAGQRYQRTFEGALNNADRQERFRARQALAEAEAQKVTHHASSVTALDAKVVSAAEITHETRYYPGCFARATMVWPQGRAASGIACVRCGAASPRDFVRLDFIVRRAKVDPLLPGSYRRPP